MLDDPGKPYPDAKGMITIREAMNRYFSLREMKETVYAGFQKTFSIRFTPVNQEFYIKDLLDKYQSHSWNYARKEKEI